MSAKPSLGAANQSRRRGTITDDKLDGSGGSAPPAFSYRGLELDKEKGSNLRLVSIEPSSTATNDDAMACTLSVRPFEDRPRFEALSYMWGPETPPGECPEILLNGVRFPVRANLLGALQYLRSEKRASAGEAEPETRLYWIDAICINQEDIEERNQQVPRMRHIYFRASTVVVWLGAGYANIQDRIPEFVIEPPSGSGDAYPKEEVEMVQRLENDAYWSRVWVLQEIGRARGLRVCFGRVCLPWTNFIQLLTLHHGVNNGSGPLWLDQKLRVDKRPGLCTLKQLLQDHQKADCSEPRDKVYGLLGLASDASGFPVDYRKSLMMIWEDTMVFLNVNGLIGNGSQIMQTGQLVKYLLASRAPNPLAQLVPRADTPLVRDGTHDGRSFHLDAMYLGSVVYLGPSTAELIAQLSAVDVWDAAVQDTFHDTERGQACLESDRLQDSLWTISRETLKRACFNQTSSIRWSPSPVGPVYYTAEWSTKARAASRVPASEDANTQLEATRKAQPIDQSDPRLVLLKNWPWSYEGNTERKVGVASDSVLAGDSLYWVKPSRTALLVRSGFTEPGKVYCQVVGTALVAEDLVSLRDKHYQNWETTYKGDTILVDAMTIFTILE
ncbi:hypothetical protein RB601_009373 [Gaeumannomyces tritici]